jgi:hypothetical protein
MLGDLLATLTDETIAIETIINTGDLTLLAAVREQAAAKGLDLATCVAQALKLYSDTASDEEWVTLMGIMNRSSDPGAVCLKRALAYALLTSEGGTVCDPVLREAK